MGVQSFKFPVDFLNNLEKPIIYIANRHKEILNSVSVYDSLSLTCNLNAYQTVSFKIYRDIDGKRQDYFNLFEEEMLIMIPGISWYEIHVETNIEPDGISKSITANSLECKLCDKRLVNFQINCNDLDIDDYVVTPFYNPADPNHSLLHKILNVSPVWTVGHVDQSLANKQRTFDLDDSDVYSFLTGDVSEAFNCLFIFDTFNCTVNAYDLDNYGQDTNIFVSMDNLAQNMTQTIDENSIFTCYRVNGGDDIQIAEVNPNGTNKIYNFEYYLPQMPQTLQNKITAYNDKYQSEKPHYEDVVARLRVQLEKIQDLYTRTPESLTSTDWTKYGLEFLESRRDSYQTQDELFCAQGMNKPGSLNYNLYKSNLELLNSVKSEIVVRESEIESARSEWNSLDTELIAIQNQFNMNKWFTNDEWKILDSYIIEETYSNDNYGAVDNTDESELSSMEKELYDKAWEDLFKKCRPQYQYSATLANILTIPEFKEFIPYFELGNFIRMETDYDAVIKLRIISFTVDYSSTQTISVTFSDSIRVKEMYDDISSIQAQANSAAISFQFNKTQYDNSVKQGNFVAEMRKYGLDVATTTIHNSSNQVQTWDSTGMTFRQWNDERQDYEPEMAKFINNMMVFSDDSMQSVRMGIGKIFLPNGESAYGFNGELVLGKLFLGEYLTLENDSGTYKFDNSGFSATSGVNTVKIQPNNSGELFSIYKGNAKQVYINSDGDVEFSGILKASKGVFGGLLSGGTINIGNGNFTVDPNGNMYVANGQFSGNISASNISSGNISGSTISGGNISGSTISGVNISGSSISGGSIKIGNGFSVDSGGNLKSISGEFYSAIFKNTIFYGLDYNGQMAYFPIINVPSQGNITFGLTNAHTTFPGSVQFDSYILINQDIVFGAGATTYGTSSGTENSKLYKANNGGNENIPSAGWVKNYVSHNMPNTSNFASKYHSHDNYVDDASYYYSSSSTTKYAPRYFNVYGNLLYVEGLLVATSSSDKRLKKNIKPLRDITSFYLDLFPIEHEWKDGYITTQKGLQFGLIAQDVENKLYVNGISNCGLVLKENAEEDEHAIHGDKITYKIDKEQLHAMHIQMIQKLWNKVDKQEKEIFKLKKIINEIIE